MADQTTFEQDGFRACKHCGRHRESHVFKADALHCPGTPLARHAPVETVGRLIKEGAPVAVIAAKLRFGWSRGNVDTVLARSLLAVNWVYRNTTEPEFHAVQPHIVALAAYLEMPR